MKFVTSRRPIELAISRRLIEFVGCRRLIEFVRSRRLIEMKMPHKVRDTANCREEGTES